MKKFTKIALMICIVAMLMGAAACAVSFSLGLSPAKLRNEVLSDHLQFDMIRYIWHDDDNDDWDLDWDDDDRDDDDSDAGRTNDSNNNIVSDDGSGADWSQNFETDAIDELEIEFKGGDLEFQESAQDEIEVSFDYDEDYDNDQRKLTCRLDSGTLKIEDERSKISKYLNGVHVVIKIPKNKSFREIDIETGAGFTNIHSALQAKQIEITLGAGEISCSQSIQAEDELKIDFGAGVLKAEDLSAPKMEIQCGTGTGEFNRITSDDLQVDCGVGSIKMNMSDTQSNYNYEVETGVGRIKIGEDSYSGLGRDKKIDNNAAKKIEVECGLGEVILGFAGNR